MNEGAPKTPEPANENIEPVENEAALSPEEKAEKIATAEKIAEELAPYTKFDKETGYPVIDRETNERLKPLQAELYEIMMDKNLSWHDLSKAKLPWDPRFEKMKQAANNNAEIKAADAA